MRGWSFPLGRPFGVELRIHGLFVLLLFLLSVFTSTAGIGGWRGVGLWLLILFAVGVRETARALAAAGFGIALRSILLLPIGGLQSATDPEHEDSLREATRFVLPAAGIGANLLVALIAAGLLTGGSAGMHLFAGPLVSPSHLLRSVVWLNVGLAVVQFVPAFPLDAGRLLRDLSVRRHGVREASRAAVGLGRMLGSGVAALGIGLLLFPNVPLAADLSPWLMIGGFFVAIGAQLDDHGSAFQSVVETVSMRDVMLVSFGVLSPSDTLEDALHQAIHSLQDDFPVVREDEIIGVVSRGALLSALRSQGNGYVQSVMERNFLVAKPEDSLGTTIRRMRQGRVGMIPVADEQNRVLGMVTLQNLRQSMVPLLEQRKLRSPGGGYSD